MMRFHFHRNWLLAILFLLPYFVIANQEVRYSITCQIENLPNGTRFYLVKSDNRGQPDTVAQSVSLNGVVDFQGGLNPEGQFYFIKLDTTQLKLANGRKSYIRVLLDSSNVLISGNLLQWPDAIVNGSIATNDYEKFLKENEHNAVTDKFMKEWQNSGGDSSELNSAVNKYKKFLLDFATSNPASFVSPLCILNAASYMEPIDMEKVYNNLSSRVKKSFYGAKLYERILMLKNKEELAIGRLIPNFQVEFANGKKESIRDIASRSKFTLIDFWAWWCGPCKADIPNMKRTYSEFHDKGFNILGISIDLDQKKWTKSIIDDGTPWLHALDVNQASKVIFGLGSIPAYLLLNQKGEIIAEDCGISSFSNANTGNVSVVDSKSLRENLYVVIGNIMANNGTSDDRK